MPTKRGSIESSSFGSGPIFTQFSYLADEINRATPKDAVGDA